MYIKINDTKYADVVCLFRPSEIVYQGESLTGITSVNGTIRAYANNDFLMREDKVSDWERQIITEGRIVLTNVPEPTPTPDPDPDPEPEDDVWAEMAQAIKDGVNSAD